MPPERVGDHVDFKVRKVDNETYPLARLTFRLNDHDGGRSINGTFPDVMAGRGPPGVSYHDHAAPDDELNVGDIVRTIDVSMQWITIVRAGEDVGGTWYCA